MKILSIGMDRAMFTEGSAVEKRTRLYGTLVDELHIIVFSHTSHELAEKQIDSTIYLYPTASRHKLLYMFDAFFIGLKIIKRIGKERVLVTTQDASETGIVGWLLSVVKKVPLHVQVHVDILSPHFISNSFSNWFRVLLSRCTFSRATRIRVVSARIKQSLIAKYGEAIETMIDVLPIYVDVSSFIPSDEKIERNNRAAKRILIVSRLESEKNVSLAIDVFNKVLVEHSEVRLTIAGDGRERKMLEKKVKECGISDTVDFVGWVDDLPRLYADAIVYVQTSNYEGYGMTLLEAAASGLPIVTTDVGLVGEVLLDGKSAYVCPVGEADCLAAHISNLLNDAEAAHSLAAAALDAAKQAQKSSVEMYMEKYLESWKKTLE